MRRNDAIDVAAAMAMRPDAILLSPGPCDPDQAGICLALVAAAAETGTPLLGVCLGHQAIGQAFGGHVVRAGRIMHGKLDTISHDGTGVFAGLPSTFVATRYHSLAVEPTTLPACLAVNAVVADGTIMGLRHRDLPIHGVQFHPEVDRLRARTRAPEELPRHGPRAGMSERLKPLIAKAAEGPLSRAQAETGFAAIMEGDATPAQIGGFLMALRTRGETVEEYAAAATAMRAKCLHVHAPEGAIDIVGTGGDGKGTLNISTAAAFVVAGAGVPVAKHGNRNLSSKSGSADALTELGINVMVGPAVVERALAEIGIGFMMAPMHHPAMRHVGPVRAELGTRTIFNLLGPLTNPAAVRRQLTGAYARSVIRPMAETLAALGSDRAWVVHGADGTDEVSIAGETYRRRAERRPGARVHRRARGGGAAAPPARGGAGRRSRRERPGAARAAGGRAVSLPRRGAAQRGGGARHRRAGGLAQGGGGGGAGEHRQRGGRPEGGAACRADRGAGAGDRALSILEEIRAYKLRDIANRKAARPQSEIEAGARAAPTPRPFAEALRKSATRGYGLIAEIKKASPSKGLIRADFDPVALAQAYQAGGATCLSVLTDGPSFQGDDSYLAAARAAVALPVLRKDFLYDPWQVAESRALGADSVLIIMATVSDAQAAELEAAAQAWAMDVLVEVHSEAELERAAALDSTLIGINNRDLATFETDPETTKRLVRLVPQDKIIVSESGLATRADLAALARYGVRCFLIGETLMREPDVEAATRALLRSPWTPDAG